MGKGPQVAPGTPVSDPYCSVMLTMIQSAVLPSTVKETGIVTIYLFIYTH